MSQRTHPRPAVRFAENGNWKEWTWPKYQSEIFKVSAGLVELGVKPKTRVAICAATRVEWALIDLATLSLHGVTVPIYPSNTAEEIEFIINHSEATVLFLETLAHLKSWKKIAPRCPQVEKVICFEKSATDEPTVMSWADFQELTNAVSQDQISKVESSLSTLQLSEMATLVYTSGTTGVPKAAVLTHEQIMSEITEAFPMCGAREDDTTLTFLPFAHVLGRIEIWAHAYIGYTMGYAQSIDTIRKDLLTVRPTFMMAVPRIFEKIYSSIWAQLEMSPVSRKLFDWALKIGKSVSEKKLHRQNLSLPLILEYELAKKLVLNKVKEAFGGRVRFVVSGGAPINDEISRFFHAAGVLILEGYGLTETTAAICVNTPYNYRFGSVGRPIGDVELKIAADGEILVKSKKVMKEYYKNPEATKESLTDGWFHTGDIGEILKSGDLKITDRKKDLIKTAGGKYVAPQKLEGLLKLNPIISHSLIHGDQKKYIVALITLDQNFLTNWAEESGTTFKNWVELISHTEITDWVRRAIAQTNSQLAPYETIKKFTILPQEFTIENGELTPSLKVKRKVLDKKFKPQIDALYS